MNTESRRKASAAYHAKRASEGLKKVTLWLSPEARAKLDALKAGAGSKDKAAELAIMAWRGTEPPLSITSDYAKRVEARVAKGGFKPQDTPFVEHMDKAPALKKLKQGEPIRTVGSLVNVQIGPTPRKPGDLAKKGKK